MRLARKAALAGFVVTLSAVIAMAKPIATSADTNLRTAPSTESAILALLPKGTTVEIGDCRNGWCRVNWNGRDGYAVARNLGAAPAASPPRRPIVAWTTYDGTPQLRDRKVGRIDGHEEEGYEHALVLEIGTAGEWPLNGDRPNFGGTLGMEVEPIEDWLELEFGLSTLATTGHAELSGDLLFKKPFRLSPTVEFMFGAGPSISQTLNGPDRGTSVSAEFALDFMMWPTKNVGWYVEPTWSVNPRNGQQSAAISVGILIGFPQR